MLRGLLINQFPEECQEEPVKQIKNKMSKDNNSP